MSISIEVEIKKILAEIGGIDESRFNENSLIARDLGIDSLRAMEIMAEVETRFNIKVPEEKVLNVETVGEFINLIKGWVKEQY